MVQFMQPEVILSSIPYYGNPQRQILHVHNVTSLFFYDIQISDFGMSRDLENESYYISQGGKIPIRWTAPEVR